MIETITDREGNTLEKRIPRTRTVCGEDVAYVLTTMMKASVSRGTCWRAKNLNRSVFAKTGTTDNNTDAWFMGFTPEVVTGVWVGYDSKKSLGKDETGSGAAGPIWVDFMQQALHYYTKDEFTVPDNVVLLEIDQDTGMRCGKDCPEQETGAFIRGTEPFTWQANNSDKKNSAFADASSGPVVIHNQ